MVQRKIGQFKKYYGDAKVDEAVVRSRESFEKTGLPAHYLERYDVPGLATGDVKLRKYRR